MGSMASAFSGFTPQALTFFRQLEKNNKREWFQPRKERFEELCRVPMQELVRQISEDLRKFAVDHVTEPRKAIFRLYRDTRFSKDKTPYKTHIAATFERPGLPKHAAAGFYFSVSHTGVEIAAGMYMPGPAELAAVRDAIANDEKTFRKLIADRKLRTALGELQGERLTRVPKGFDPRHSAGDFLRMKQFYFGVELSAETALKPVIRRAITDRFRAATPFVNFINQAALSRLKHDEPAGPMIPKRPEPMF